MKASDRLFTTTVTGFAQNRTLRKQQERLYTGQEQKESSEAMEIELRKYTDESVRLQRALGLDVPDAARSDYPDEIGAFALLSGGLKIDLTAGGMSRHTVTNTYISKPSVSGQVRFARKIFTGTGENGKTLKVSIPGIYTLATRVLKPDSEHFDRLLDSLVTPYNTAVASLKVPFIQFNEYELLKEPTDGNIERIKRIYRRVSFVGKKILAFYFGDIGPIVDHLDDLPADIIHLDVFYDKNGAHLLRNAPKRKEVVAGLLDSVQYRADDEALAIRFAGQLAEKIDPAKLWISTNGDLAYRGRSFAESKIAALVRIANTLRSQ